MTTVSFKLEDDELEAFLDDQENRSETIREALRVYQWKQEGVQDDRLTDQQRVAYQWMLEQTDGGGRLSLEVAKTVLAQQLSMSSGIIKEQVFKPLQRHGYLVPVQYTTYVVLVVLTPSSVEQPEDPPERDETGSEGEEAQEMAVDDPEEAAARLEELAAGTPVR